MHGFWNRPNQRGPKAKAKKRPAEKVVGHLVGAQRQEGGHHPQPGTKNGSVSRSEREREEKRREFVDHIEETCPCRSTGDSTCWLPFLAESSGETRNRPPPHLRSALLPTRAMGRAKEKRRQRWVGDSLNERMGVLDLRKKGV